MIPFAQCKYSALFTYKHTYLHT